MLSPGGAFTPQGGHVEPAGGGPFAGGPDPAPASPGPSEPDGGSGGGGFGWRGPSVGPCHGFHQTVHGAVSPLASATGATSD